MMYSRLCLHWTEQTHYNCEKNIHKVHSMYNLHLGYFTPQNVVVYTGPKKVISHPAGVSEKQAQAAVFLS